MQKSINRKIKRSHLRVSKCVFVKNEDGTPKIYLEKKTKRGRWILK